MSASAVRVLVAATCVLWLGGCETSTKLSDIFSSSSFSSSASSSSDPETTASIEGPITGPTTVASLEAAAVPEPNAGSSGLVGKDPNDEISLGKKHYHAGNFGVAEQHFRRAVEQYPHDAEAWVGLAASYDRLKRFALADRAYAQARKLIGETPEILNNIGYSYLLRGDYPRARKTLLAAQAMDPDNPYVKNNLQLLERSQRQGKAVR
jgi:tetratricopeptide (TPR) repeat protein